MAVAVVEDQSVFLVIGVLAKNGDNGLSGFVEFDVMAEDFGSYEVVCVVDGERNGVAACVDDRAVEDPGLYLGVDILHLNPV